MKSDSSTSSAGSEGSGSDSKKRIVSWCIPRAAIIEKKLHGYSGPPRPKLEMIHPLTAGEVYFVVSGRMTSTSTPTKSTPNTSEKKTITQATLEKSTQQTSHRMTSFAEDFLANRLALPGKGKVSRTLVERFSSRYSELRRTTDLACYSWKTLKDYYPRPSSMKQVTLSQEPTEESLKQSSSPWKTWGCGGSTKFLTARITGSHRTGKECSLSDILETEVPDRYFLSSNQVESLMNGMQESKLHQLFNTQDTVEETTEE